MNEIQNKLLPKNRLGRSVLGLASGTAFSQAIIILASPILTRLYTPIDFGVLSLYIAIVAVIGVIAGLRYEFALPVVSNKEDAIILVLIGFGLTLLTGLLSWLILLALWDFIEAVFGLESLRPYIWMLPAGIVSIGIFNTFTLWGTREQNYALLAYSKLTQGITIVCSQVGLGLMTVGGLGLIIGDVTGRLFASFHMALGMKRLPFQVKQHLSWKAVKTLLFRFRRFPLMSAPASFLNTLGLRLPVMLVGGFYSIEAAGWLMLSQMVVGSPMTLIGQSVSRVYSGELGQRRRENPSSMESLFLNITYRLAIYCTIPILILAFLSPFLFEAIFGEGWQMAGFYTRVLALMLILQIIVSPVSSTLTLLEKQDKQLVWDMVRVLVVIFGFWFSAEQGFSDLMALSIYCVIMMLLYIVLWYISLVEIRRFLVVDGNDIG